MLNIALLGTIGWTVWRRATISDQWQQIRDVDREQGTGNQDMASQLREGIGAAQDRMAIARQALPTDADLAGYVADLRAEGALMGVAVTEIIPQSTPPSAVPVRCFTVHAQGLWPQLLGFVSQVSRAPLSTARVDNVTVTRGTTIDTLSFDLIVAVRPPEPLAEAPAPDLIAASNSHR